MRPLEKHGFTLMELLVTMAILGVLVAVAIPKFASSREKALLTAMKADLRNLANAEEAYAIQHFAYTTSFPATVYTVTAGVTGPTITLTADGWTASVGHGASSETCAIFAGTTPLAPAVDEGVPKCTQGQTGKSGKCRGGPC
ncbi:MAG: prepilin-type N-terminal cleavage/methylation domain-containing protein [Gemmatimonadota bacterium]|nr:prepilin-type N-terminal cleavage/methylation domain-containing protein [Gemmatimonadota bacterium]MDH3369341.1 prepilin-type N-terminal cleavage/methylation domain-containing protein [Gemmatimonadota bacterium]MDH3479792.1 prepilin-type N-terminal cleavage/methylation domain-containing protein [Gemmatimonadota bacterium]MDH3569168.1 prepilin-type N-terminal cleavage/methylation domain-containing protein [Gemmatimonadota bacterium]MDH5549261.1 prepilin-type N-terminal cleavage/methylation do